MITVLFIKSTLVKFYSAMGEFESRWFTKIGDDPFTIVDLKKKYVGMNLKKEQTLCIDEYIWMWCLIHTNTNNG